MMQMWFQMLKILTFFKSSGRWGYKSNSEATVDLIDGARLFLDDPT